MFLYEVAKILNYFQFQVISDNHASLNKVSTESLSKIAIFGKDFMLQLRYNKYEVFDQKILGRTQKLNCHWTKYHQNAHLCTSTKCKGKEKEEGTSYYCFGTGVNYFSIHCECASNIVRYVRELGKLDFNFEGTKQ